MAVVTTTFIGNTDVNSFLGLAFIPFQIFADGFESGDTAAWSSSIP